MILGGAELCGAELNGAPDAHSLVQPALSANPGGWEPNGVELNGGYQPALIPTPPPPPPPPPPVIRVVSALDIRHRPVRIYRAVGLTRQPRQSSQGRAVARPPLKPAPEQNISLPIPSSRPSTPLGVRATGQTRQASQVGSGLAMAREPDWRDDPAILLALLS